LSETQLGAIKLKALQTKLEAVDHNYGMHADPDYEPEMALLVTVRGQTVVRWTRKYQTLLGMFEGDSRPRQILDVDNAFDETVRFLIRQRHRTGT
jgi:hypothetical protein